MDKNLELTEEQRQQAKELLEDQMTKLGEVFSQCWESDEFKEAFIEDPKAIFDEYGINYDKDRRYKVFQTPDKTLVHVLPYKGVKQGIKNFVELLNKHVEDIEENDEKQILPEDWSWQVYQNTEDMYYIPIPICPEDLTPEELELVNGGCLVAILVFVFQSAVLATTTTGVAETFALFVAYVDVMLAAEVAFAAAVAVAAVEALLTVTTLMAHFEYSYTTNTNTGAYIIVNSIVVDETPSTVPGPTTGSVGSVDPRKRGR